jgi:hypothetical protein
LSCLGMGKRSVCRCGCSCDVGARERESEGAWERGSKGVRRLCMAMVNGSPIVCPVLDGGEGTRGCEAFWVGWGYVNGHSFIVRTLCIYLFN